MYCCNFLFRLCPLSHFPNISRHVLNPYYVVFFNDLGKGAKCFYNEVLLDYTKALLGISTFMYENPFLLDPGPTGTGTITFNPTFGGFTLLEPIFLLGDSF